MLDQSDVIRRIDHDSKVAAEALPAMSGKNRVIIFYRLIFLPLVCFIRAMVSGKRLSGRPGGLYGSFNEAALIFITEAKRYENIYIGKTNPVKDSQDFYQLNV